MTVTYSLNVSRARLCGFAKLLMRWKGSIYKLLYKEMLIFCGLYYGLLIIYRLVLTEHQRGVFEKMVMYCGAFTELIPLSFVLGFYVTLVVGRWWQQFMAIPWPDKVCMLIAAYIHGTDERSRVIRRTLARYLNLMSALTFQAISPTVKKRFPTLEHLEEAGLMTKEEHTVYDKLHLTHGKWWVPAQWFTSLVIKARKEGRIADDVLLKHLLDEMHVFRGNCGLLFSFDWISIPLVYTQVVTLAIYTYFLATVMGRQYLNPQKGYPGHEIDLYVPVFTLLQFFFYMGWLKVAEQLINPFGEDDDDFELNWCLDRNLQLSLTVVDEMYLRHPCLVRDIYWDEAEPYLPYTKSSVNLRSQPHLGSAVDLDVNLQAEFLPMGTIMEQDNTENHYNSLPRSPSGELVNHLGFPIPPDAHLQSATSDGDASLSTQKFPSSRLLNMIMSSNQDLSSSSECISGKETQASIMATPFFLRTPSSQKKRSSSVSLLSPLPSEEQCTNDATMSAKPTDCGLVEEYVGYQLPEAMFLERPPEICVINIPDLSILEEETQSSRTSSPITDQEFEHVVLQVDACSDIDLPPPVPPQSYDSDSSQETSCSQSTVNSYTELLNHVV